MSLAEPLASPAVVRPEPVRASRLSVRFLRSEIRMVFRRRRNIAMLAVLALIPVVIGIAVKLTTNHGQGGGGNGAALFSGIINNGLFLSLSALFVVLPLFLPMAIAVVSGEAVAGEANIGTLRYLLAVPVSRSRLLTVKYAGILAWCFAAAVIVAVFGLVAGLVLFPSGEMTLLSGTTVSYAAGIYRLFLVTIYAVIMMAAVGAIGLFVSTLTEVPVAAMATTLALAITSEVLDAVPQLHAIHGALFSHYWQQFLDLLRDPLTFSHVWNGVLVSLAYIAIFLSLAWARFTTKDVSS